MPSSFETLTRTEIEALPRDRTVFFFSVGPMEDHGPHLPVGMDTLSAFEISKLISQKLKNIECVWMPPLYMGVDTHTSEFALKVRPYVLRDYLVDTCRGLSKRGFNYFAVVSGQLGPRQLTAIEEAGKLINRGWPMGGRLNKRWLFSLSSNWVRGEDVRRSPLWSDPVEHAGAADTALAQNLKISGVQTAMIAGLPPILRTSESWIARAFALLTGGTSGYWGDPARANLSESKISLDRKVESAAEFLQNALNQGEHGKRIQRPQSKYHWFPTNRTFFKAWFLFLLIMLVVLVWFYFIFDYF